jgi:Sedlin, N-terminal conserved region
MLARAPQRTASCIAGNMRMQNVDRFNKMNVSALVAPSNGTILVLHSEGKPSDDAIKHFLFDVSDLYMKVRSAMSCEGIH